MKRRVLISSVIILLLAWLSFVWPTPYRYGEISMGTTQTRPLRMNRFTGQIESWSRTEKRWQ